MELFWRLYLKYKMVIYKKASAIGSFALAPRERNLSNPLVREK